MSVPQPTGESSAPLEQAYGMLGEIEAHLQGSADEQRQALEQLDAREAQLVKDDSPAAQAELEELRRARQVAVDDVAGDDGDAPR